MKLFLALTPAALLAACSAQDGASMPAGGGDDAVATPAASASAPAPSASATEIAPETAKVIPAAFHGTWENPTNGCAVPSDANLVISADTLQFYEAVGKVTSVKVERPDRIVVTATVTGEGETREDSYLFELRDGGKMLSSNGVDETASTPFLRKRCN